MGRRRGAVDALLGEQTRPHDDLDVYISSAHVEVSLQVLGSLGFEMATDERPQGYVLRDAADRRVDFHPLVMQSDGSGIQLLLGGGADVMPPVLFQGAGLIGGRSVRCAPLEESVREHLGYEPDEQDYRDMRALRDHFGIPLPPPYDEPPA